MKPRKLLTACFGALCVATIATDAVAEVPNEFASGEVLRAADLNENFAALSTLLDSHDSRITTSEDDVLSLQQRVSGLEKLAHVQHYDLAVVTEGDWTNQTTVVMVNRPGARILGVSAELGHGVKATYSIGHALFGAPGPNVSQLPHWGPVDEVHYDGELPSFDEVPYVVVTATRGGGSESTGLNLSIDYVE